MDNDILSMLVYLLVFMVFVVFLGFCVFLLAEHLQDRRNRLQRNMVKERVRQVLLSDKRERENEHRPLSFELFQVRRGSEIVAVEEYGTNCLLVTHLFDRGFQVQLYLNMSKEDVLNWALSEHPWSRPVATFVPSMEGLKAARRAAQFIT